MTRDKLQKLINHERSARAIGNIAEADNYARKISEIKAAQPKPAAPTKHTAAQCFGSFEIRLKCSCGCHFSVTAGDRGYVENSANHFIFSHASAGHRVRPGSQ